MLDRLECCLLAEWSQGSAWSWELAMTGIVISGAVLFGPSLEGFLSFPRWAGLSVPSRLACRGVLVLMYDPLKTTICF